MKNKKADLSLALVAIIWGTGFVASKVALDANLAPFQIMTYRFFISSVAMVILFWKEFKKIKLPVLKSGSLIGFFLFIAFAFQTIGLQYTTPSKNAFITATNVVIVPFLYWIIAKKSPDKYSLFGALLTVIGISFLTLDGSFTINFGDFLTLICAFGFAMHITAISYYAEKYNPIQLTTIQMIVAFLFSLVSQLMTKNSTPITKNGGLAILYLGIISTTIAFLIQNIAQKYTSATKTAIILSTEAVFGTLASVILLGEKLSLKMLMGCGIIFLAIIITETKLSFLKRGIS
ncbi:DMT family transporter [Clostridium algidicarnis]|uniref:Drug/metabolite transporter (DMT)-like permease n=2 Tax=Clostridium algidicarnis TaxID=37659 RepID=A0A2S6FX50_9CLOT|nr:DMT family transporter [Clostridium algidicarnis]MBB6632282.1 DMT family transporter [Clostridium algidicarnis]MBU3197655.1 DMT family transporter [Clostridium algidicarnis]MBU3219657.1 DMT family transporter [Clostridium algidicarnis]MCB2287545.1 DMT family transporter [Clostridium algidicarnis]PPK48042.1 drug/metabolite transporter (DMT)-like permease [Clostridium algidicarnis DSM 15099]